MDGCIPHILYWTGPASALLASCGCCSPPLEHVSSSHADLRDGNGQLRNSFTAGSEPELIAQPKVLQLLLSGSTDSQTGMNTVQITSSQCAENVTADPPSVHISEVACLVTQVLEPAALDVAVVRQADGSASYSIAIAGRGTEVLHVQPPEGL